MSDAEPNFELILVTYHSRDLVQQLLASLPTHVRVAIVDNAQDADGLASVAAGRPRTRYLTGPGQGFARGANLGAATSTATTAVFVNPDSAPTYEQLLTLVERAQSDPQVAGVCGITVQPNGQIELGVGGWEPTPVRLWVHALGLHRLLPTAGVYARPTPHQPCELEWLSGACLAVRRKTFLDLGGFDDQYFVYNEDMAYGRRAREAGLRLQVSTDIVIPHEGAGSGETKPRMFQLRAASMMQYLGAHNTWGRTRVMRWALTVGTGIRWLVAKARRHTDLAQCHAAYLRGLRFGAPDMTAL